MREKEERDALKANFYPRPETRRCQQNPNIDLKKIKQIYISYPSICDLLSSNLDQLTNGTKNPKSYNISTKTPFQSNHKTEPSILNQTTEETIPPKIGIYPGPSLWKDWFEEEIFLPFSFWGWRRNINLCINGRRRWFGVGLRKHVCWRWLGWVDGHLDGPRKPLVIQLLASFGAVTPLLGVVVWASAPHLNRKTCALNNWQVSGSIVGRDMMIYGPTNRYVTRLSLLFSPLTQEFNHIQVKHDTMTNYEKRLHHCDFIWSKLGTFGGLSSYSHHFYISCSAFCLSKNLHYLCNLFGWDQHGTCLKNEIYKNETPLNIVNYKTNSNYKPKHMTISKSFDPFGLLDKLVTSFDRSKRYDKNDPICLLYSLIHSCLCSTYEFAHNIDVILWSLRFASGVLHLDQLWDCFPSQVLTIEKISLGDLLLAAAVSMNCLQVVDIVLLRYEGLGLIGWRKLMTGQGEIERRWRRRTKCSFKGLRTTWMLLLCNS